MCRLHEALRTEGPQPERNQMLGTHITRYTGAGLLTLAGVGVLSIALVPMLRRRKTRAAV